MLLVSFVSLIAESSMGISYNEVRIQRARVVEPHNLISWSFWMKSSKSGALYSNTKKSKNGA